MSIFFFLSLLLLPLFYAQHFPTKFDNNDELLMPRSGAANYLYGLPMRRYQHQLAHAPVDSSSSISIASDSDDQQQQQQQRGKRIYWENLAFQPADYNQKAKNPKRSK